MKLDHSRNIYEIIFKKNIAAEQTNSELFYGNHVLKVSISTH